MGAAKTLTKWTYPQQAHLTELFYVGKTDRQISEEIGGGHTAQAIRNRRRHLGLIRRPRAYRFR